MVNGSSVFYKALGIIWIGLLLIKCGRYVFFEILPLYMFDKKNISRLKVYNDGFL